MPGQTWLDAMASFLGMWIVMMAVMMLPSAILMLWRYRQGGGRRLGIAGAGYFFVWTLIGVAVFPFGAALMSLSMELPVMARAAPITVGVAVLIAGVYQFTPWKAHHLRLCRQAMAARSTSAWRHGMRFGLHCARSCANLMAITLVIGVTDVRVMTVVGMLIAAERLSLEVPARIRTSRTPAGQRG